MRIDIYLPGLVDLHFIIFRVLNASHLVVILKNIIEGRIFLNKDVDGFVA